MLLYLGKMRHDKDAAKPVNNSTSQGKYYNYKHTISLYLP